MIEVRNIHHCLSGKMIIDELSFELNTGELLCVLGPNGAGKSTLLKLLSGESHCKSGQVLYNKQAIHELNPKQLSKIRAVMPQHSTVSFPFSAKEIIIIGSDLNKNELAKTLAEVTKLTKVDQLLDRPYQQLSGGEKQRVQLARVLMQIWKDAPYPRFLFLDEPTSSLDIAQQYQVFEIVKSLKSKNIGILAVVHDINLAAQSADKVLLLKSGRAMAFGTTDEIITKENISRTFDHQVLIQAHPITQKPLIISNINQNYHAKTYGNISYAN